MFEVHSAAEIQQMNAITPVLNTTRPSKVQTSPVKGVWSRSFTSITAVLSEWDPSDSKALYRLMVSEVGTLLEQHVHSCIKACIPSLIVDGQYPVQVMRYEGEKDFNEFLSRMMWLQQEFQSAIGILVGVPNDETANQIEEDCYSLLDMNDELAVILI